MELNSKTKGNITELSCILEFVKRGYQVSIPYGENAKYDFVVDINNKFYRFQSKTCRFTDGRTCSVRFNKKAIKRGVDKTKIDNYTKDDIDYFCTFYNGICYIVDVNTESKNQFAIRIGNSKHNQTKGINFAEDYTIDKFLSNINMK